MKEGLNLLARTGISLDTNIMKFAKEESEKLFGKINLSAYISYLITKECKHTQRKSHLQANSDIK